MVIASAKDAAHLDVASQLGLVDDLMAVRNSERSANVKGIDCLVMVGEVATEVLVVIEMKKGGFVPRPPSSPLFPRPPSSSTSERPSLRREVSLFGQSGIA